MPSREAIPVRGARFLPLLMTEVREMWLGKSIWIALTIAVLLTGYSYIQAVNLYAEASRTALKVPELARGLSPLDGIFVPTLGALYIVATFLFPLVVIRTISAEKPNGAHKLVVQLPYSMTALIAARAISVLLAWGAMLIPSLTALALWATAGGHISAWEAANLLLGHFLYAWVVAGIALAAAAVTQSTASAAILALCLTLSFWVLDFAAAGEDGLLKSLAGLSLTKVLRNFERGIFSLPAVLGMLSAGVGGATIAGAWLHPGQSALRRWCSSAVVAMGVVVALAVMAQVHVYGDATEEGRNSFRPADAAALRALRGKLIVTAYLAPTDPRLYDLERSVLSKLARTMSQVQIVSPDIAGSHGIAASSDDHYGEVKYEFNGRQAISRSTSVEEILPLIFQLAEVERPKPGNESDYPGYPLVAETKGAATGFYFLLPAAVLISWGISRGAWRATRRPRQP